MLLDTTRCGSSPSFMDDAIRGQLLPFSVEEISKQKQPTLRDAKDGPPDTKISQVPKCEAPGHPIYLYWKLMDSMPRNSAA